MRPMHLFFNGQMGSGLRRGGSLPNRSQSSRVKLAGFSLLEMSIVLVIISTMAAGAITYLSVSLDRRGLYETQHKLAVIQDTLMNFRLAYNRIPCPAVMTETYGTANFGAEVDHTAGCPGLPIGLSHPAVV